MRPEMPFFAAAAFSLVNALYGYFVLPESLPRALRTPFSLKKANAFSALKGLIELKGLGMFVLAITLMNLAQFMMHSVWVRYTETRFSWTPRDNGFALFAVGISAAIVQGALLGPLIKLWGETRLAKIGLFFATLEFVLFGLANAGYEFYLIMTVCLLANAAGPALQAIVSRQVAPEKQGIAMGSLTSIGSITQVAAPFISLTILSEFTHAPGALQTLQAGMPFFASAILQFIAFALAIFYFSKNTKA